MGKSRPGPLAARLASAGIVAVYSSPIGRALQTARLVAEKAGVEVLPEPRVQEYDFGEALSGLTWQEIREKHPDTIAALLSDDKEFPRYPGEEGRAAFKNRVCSAIRDIAERRRQDAAVAVVTHAGAAAVFVLELLGRKYTRPVPFTIGNASVTTVEFGMAPLPGMPEWVLAGLNDTCHLRPSEATAGES